MIELCQTIHKPILLIGSTEDFHRAKELVDFFEEKNTNVVVLNVCGKYNLNQTASLIRQADEVYTHDTGLMHIAAAFKKKIYSIWGNTVPAFGMYPYKTEYVIWENNNLSCRPCSKIGYSKCPKKHFKCMNDLIFKN
jgi:ADP-heptose:LPS heptosyltransferase